MANYPGYNPTYPNAGQVGQGYPSNQISGSYGGSYGGSAYPQMQQMSQMPQTMSMEQQKQINPAMTWVDGEFAARAFTVPVTQPLGQPYPIWDSDCIHVYFKTLDQFGRPTMRRARYMFDDEPQQTLPQGMSETAAPNMDMSGFVTKSDFDSFKNELREMLNRDNKNFQNGVNKNKGGNQNV